MEPVSECSSAGELVLDTCAGTLMTAKDCLRLSEHSRIYGCEMDAACFPDALPSQMEVYTKHVLSPCSNVAGNEHAVEASKVFLKEVIVFTSKRKVGSWTVLPVIVPVQTFPVHIMYLLQNVCKDETLIEKG